MSRSHRLLAPLGLAVHLVACRTPEAAPEATTAASGAEAPATRGLPLALTDMLELVGPSEDYVVLRDAQALIDAGVPWQALSLAGSADGDPPGFLVQLQKWVEGSDPPLRRAGIDLRGGLVLTHVPEVGDVFVLASSDPPLTATLLTTLPFARSDHTTCQRLADVPPYAICATDEAPLAKYRPGGGAARRAALAAALPGVDIDGAMVLGASPDLDVQFADEIGVGQQTLHVHVGGDTMRAVDAALAPGPAELLRFVQPGVGFVWARVDAAALRLLKPDLLGDEEPLRGLTNAWTGELLLSGLAEPTALQLRVGVTDTASAKQLLGLLALDATDAKPGPLDGVPGATIHRDAGELELAGESTPTLRMWIEGAPEIAAIAESLGLAPRLSLFAAHGSLALVVGSDDAKAALAPLPEPEAALRDFPPAALADLRAGRVLALMHAPLDVLQSPQMRAALDLAAPRLDAATVTALRGLISAATPMSRVTAWGSETDGRLVWHVTLTNIGNTAAAEGQAAIAATRAAPESAAAAFAALAAGYPEAPLAAGYRARAGASGPAALGRSLVGAALIVVPLLERLTAEPAPTP